VPGRTGSFTIPTTGEPPADTWYEIIVTATDTTGLFTTKSVNIHPRESHISPATGSLVTFGWRHATHLRRS
jgi:hypothetical protein